MRVLHQCPVPQQMEKSSIICNDDRIIICEDEKVIICDDEKNIICEEKIICDDDDERDIICEEEVEQLFIYDDVEMVELFQMKPFHGLKLSFLGFSPEETEHMQETTIQNGGEFFPVGTVGCTHLVVEEMNQSVMPEVQAIHVVKQEWFWASIQLDACAEESFYFFVGDQGTPLGTGLRKKRKNINNVYDISDLFSPGSSFNSNNVHKRRSKDRLSISTIFDSSLSPLSSSVFGSPEVPNTRKALTARNQTCLELQQTERNYVDVLRNIIKIFKEPLEKSADQRGGSLLPPEDIRTIFSALPDLLKVHEKLLASVDVLVNNWHEEQLIGKCIVDCAEGMMKSYPTFVNYFDMIKETIVKCDKERPRFHAFLKICLNKPDCGRQSLTELLIRPVQRLPSLSLLLNDILKHTPESNPDHKYLKESVDSIKKVLTFINEGRRQTEYLFQIFEITGGIENCPPYILSAHRVLVSKAEVQEVSEGLTVKCDHMQMFLFNDSIEIAKRRNRIASNTGSTKSPALMPRGTQLKQPYKHVEFIKLSSLKSVVDIKDEGEYKDLFGLVYFSTTLNKDTLSVFKFNGGGNTRNEWIDKIVKCLCETKVPADTENFLVSVDARELANDKGDTTTNKEKSSGQITRFIRKSLKKKVFRTFSLSKTPKLQQQSNSTLRRAMSSITPVGGDPMTPDTPLSPSLSGYSVMEVSVCDGKK